VTTQQLPTLAPGAPPAAAGLACRFCDAALAEVFVDLGMSPLSNSYLRAEDLPRPETFYPLCTYVCGSCFLVQLPEAASPEEIFGDYAYFSSYSDTWLRHAETYVERAADRFGLGPGHQVIEIASNDGYLLQYFQRRGVPVLGVEPARNVAAAAQERGIPTLVRFFGLETARELAADGKQADLLVANNVLAHTPYLNDFVAGIAAVLAPAGVATLEFPHLVRLVGENQFDTIYHEHFSYFSCTTVRRVFAAHGLELFDVEELPTHGGSLRVYARRAGESGGEPAATGPVGDRVGDLLAREAAWGVERLATYRSFAERVRQTKIGLLDFLIREQRAGRTMAGYGAPAKGNTLLNFCGVRTDLLPYTVDRSPHKQGCFLPGTRIPIHSPDHIRATRPDYVLILPWNLRQEVMEQMADVRSWGGRFVVAIPELTVYP
jgi:SAM-dependent methyltransferase